MLTRKQIKVGAIVTLHNGLTGRVVFVNRWDSYNVAVETETTHKAIIWAVPLHHVKDLV